VFRSCHHELETARINGLLGNIDANSGDPQIGMLHENMRILIKHVNVFPCYCYNTTRLEDMKAYP